MGLYRTVVFFLDCDSWRSSGKIYKHGYISIIFLQPIIDPDPIQICDLMEQREKFLIFASENNCEFSSVRRAKYSTLVMLYELHNKESHDEYSYHCDYCKVDVLIR